MWFDKTIGEHNDDNCYQSAMNINMRYSTAELKIRLWATEHHGDKYALRSENEGIVFTYC